jgi:hypothetical protein
MFSDHDHPYSSVFETPESRLRFGMMFAELWHDWFEAMSEVAYRTHRACEFVLEDGGPAKSKHGPFDPSRWQSEGPNGAVDVDKLKECLQAMEPMEAARVIHAVQMMQAMEAMLKRKRSRASEAERPAW